MFNRRLKNICYSIKTLLILAGIILSQATFGQNVKIGATNAAPNAAAMLDVDGVTGVGAAYKGILIPRMTYAQRTSLATLAAIAQGLLVYQTDTVGSFVQGFYYNTSLTTTPNWVYLGGGSTTVTATAPVFSSGGATPNISLQGTAGGVFYGTGGGSNITGAGTTIVPQFLQSNGAAAPTWVDALNPLYNNTYVAYSTGSASISSTTGLTLIPGASVTINVASNTNKIYVYADGGSQTTATSSSGYSIQDVLITLDGAYGAGYQGGYKRVFEFNNNLFYNMLANWTLATVITNVSAGSHTFAVGSLGANENGSTANVGSAQGYVMQVTLVVVEVDQ